MARKYLSKQMYDSMYGDIPDTQSARVDMILNTRFASTVKGKVKSIMDDIASIKRKKFVFTWYTEPHPSARPRATMSTGFIRMYVPLAAATKADFKKFWAENFPQVKLPISTPTDFRVKVYLRTPKSYPRALKVLAEIGAIKPWGRQADVDNLWKTYTDCTIGSMIADDDFIDTMKCEKFFSLKPRVEFEVTYWARWPKGLEKLIRQPEILLKKDGDK